MDKTEKKTASKCIAESCRNYGITTRYVFSSRYRGNVFKSIVCGLISDRTQAMDFG